MILNRAKDYYENDKERLRGQARDKYRNLSEEEKKKKKRIWEKQISQYQKQRFKKYQKHYLYIYDILDRLAEIKA